MNNLELEFFLKEKCDKLKLKEKAFNTIKQIILENFEEEDFLGGFDKEEIKPIFDRYQFFIGNRFGLTNFISVRFGLYIDDPKEIWIDNIERIGYYELEVDFQGEILDDWFIIEKEKYLKDFDIVSNLQYINKDLPLQYLKRNHKYYKFVSYISHIGTLFSCKKFNECYLFLERAIKFYEKIQINEINEKYFNKCKRFLTILKEHLIEDNLISEEILKMYYNK